MDSRRDFLKKAALLSAGTGLLGALPPSIQKALAINPDAGSTYLDAEHIVILMQENRSFDHCYGTLQGVRGYNDPRAITLANKNPVWLQSNPAGETYAPFRLNIKDTKATWMGSLPHSWSNQVDAMNKGKFDQWLLAKPSGNKEYKHMPLTMGYYNREDIPFYYSLADAFTVCDQNFCSSLTGTTPNRLYFWTGTIKDEQNENSPARVRNDDTDYPTPARWNSFPEQLEEHDISWKIYQNELSVGVGFENEEDAWLANFTDNPLEWFAQYNVQFSHSFMSHSAKQVEVMNRQITMLEQKLAGLPATGKPSEVIKKQIKEMKETLVFIQEVQKNATPENYAKLSQKEKNLAEKAFCTNKNDPFYHELDTLKYDDDGTGRDVKIPKGDVLHQFRDDVAKGTLPTVSWLVAPENFSDHPGAPWYGAWYVSEVLDILTQKPEVWKKTIFILAYDENDGYFDHVPPFVAPHEPGTGLVSKGIDTGVEYVSMEQELKRRPADEARSGPIGLGYRVPLVVASPWSRGGAVCSQVFDHTSVLQFMEKFLSHKTGKKIEAPNVSDWRRTVCGDLTSVFRPYHGEKITVPSFPTKDAFFESVHKAKFKQAPQGYKLLSVEEVQQAAANPLTASFMPQQEKGIRSSRALPYQLYANGQLSKDKKTFNIQLQAKNEIFAKKAAGSAFNIYAPGRYKNEPVTLWSYAVTAGDQLQDNWTLDDFENKQYHLRVYGPNGFYREFKGNDQDPDLQVETEYHRKGNVLTGNLELRVTNINAADAYTVEIKDNAYKSGDHTKTVSASGTQSAIVLDLQKSFGWYDFTVRVKGKTSFEKRYAGRVETGKDSFSDPAMGRVSI